MTERQSAWAVVEDLGTSPNRNQLKNKIAKLNKGGLFLQDQEANIMNLVLPDPDDDILDIGCCTGKYEAVFSRICKITGIDIQDYIIQAAKKYAVQHGRPENIDFRLYDRPLNILFPEKKFTKIMLLDLVEHVTDNTLKRIFHEIKPLMTPTSRLYIYTPNRTHWTETLRSLGILKPMSGHINLKTKQEIISLLHEQQFNPEKAYYRPGFLPVIKWIENIIPFAFFKKRICIVSALAE